jgi:hypothetical protein
VKSPPKVISRGGLSEKEIKLSTLIFHRRVKGKVMGAIRPAPRLRKGLCLDTKGDHYCFRGSFDSIIEDP